MTGVRNHIPITQFLMEFNKTFCILWAYILSTQSETPLKCLCEMRVKLVIPTELCEIWVIFEVSKAPTSLWIIYTAPKIRQVGLLYTSAYSPIKIATQSALRSSRNWTFCAGWVCLKPLSWASSDENEPWGTWYGWGDVPNTFSGYLNPFSNKKYPRPSLQSPEKPQQLLSMTAILRFLNAQTGTGTVRGKYGLYSF